ncbi:hypothetical protein [Streptomyces sp. NPDC057280]|uniref:hypothetical protein n=1 Tax=Streptomyces sp. NPDC057280 TaxID=3346081 RepID=UPI00362F63A9
MTLNLSAVLLFALASVVAVRSRAANGGAAVVLFLFGFFTAGTGAYGPIRDLVASFARFLTSLG